VLSLSYSVNCSAGMRKDGARQLIIPRTNVQHRDFCLKLESFSGWRPKMRLRPFYSDKLVCALCGLGCRRCLFSSPSRYVGHGREKRREREREERREKKLWNAHISARPLSLPLILWLWPSFRYLVVSSLCSSLSFIPLIFLIC
jgi:hypothetical protein